MSDVLAGLPWMIGVIVLPLAAATMLFVRGRTVGGQFELAASAGVGLAVGGLTWQIWQQGPLRYRIGGWGIPLGIDLQADGLSVLMLLTTAVVGLSVAVYAVGYFAASAERHSFWVLWLMLWGAMNALFLAADIFNLYVTLELVTLAAVALVALAGGTAVSAAMHYLLAALLGSLLYLLAVALLYWSAGTLDVATLGRSLASGLPATAAVTLATLGLFLKAALFPLHFWLPRAHADAPSPVSALLSAVVVTAAYYLLLRLWFDAFHAVVSLEAAVVLGVLGTAAIVWGSLQAMITPRLKLLVAYSTVAQLGYLFLVFPLASSGSTEVTAWHGGALYAVSHACAKGALFLAAGSLLHAFGHDRLADLGGAAHWLPMPMFTIGLASVALVGLPPSGTFVAKWILIDSALVAGHWVFAAVTVAGGLLAAGYLLRVVGPSLSQVTAGPPPLRHLPGTMTWPALVLAAVAVLLGFAASPALRLLDMGAPAAIRVAGEPRP